MESKFYGIIRKLFAHFRLAAGTRKVPAQDGEGREEKGAFTTGHSYRGQPGGLLKESCYMTAQGGCHRGAIFIERFR